MSKVKLAISGCMGRMGQQLVKSSKADKNFTLATLTESRLIKKKIAGIKPSLNDENSFKNLQSFEELGRKKIVEIVDLVKSFPTRMWSSKSASIRRRTDGLKFEMEKWVSRWRIEFVAT